MSSTKEDMIIYNQLTKLGKELGKKAMETMGYIITIENDWVVKIFKDGRIEKIQKFK